MPNWVYNTVSFDGEDEDIKKLVEFVKGETDFDFNKIIPMPEELNIESSSITYLSFAIERYNQTKNDSKLEDILKKYRGNNEPLTSTIQFLKENKRYNEELGKKAYNNYKKYGCTDWYDWCWRNWNTKWNACECMTNGDGSISFSTAWNIPYPIFLKLSELFPKITIENSCTFESDSGLVLNIYLNGKEIKSSDY